MLLHRRESLDPYIADDECSDPLKRQTMSTLEVSSDSFFNSLPVQTHEDGSHSGDSPDNVRPGEELTTKPKRIACLICRKRKLRCDGIRPSCGNCSRLGHDCGYSDIRKKSGPRRGYVKELEARLRKTTYKLGGIVVYEKQIKLSINSERKMMGQRARRMASSQEAIVLKQS